ncbi:MAG: MFS transporter [Jiangellaceae bacterium]
MSPLTSYRRLLALTGPGYVVVSFLGRLPLAMSQLGTLLLVSTATGRYAAGGFAAGVLAVSNAVGAPVAGGVADRIGQRPVVLVQALTSSATLVALVMLVSAGAALPVIVLAAAAAGLSMPQVGSLARVRWRPITRGTGSVQPRLVDAAFSYEGAADEASFVLGPAVVGALAVVVDPGGALLAAAGLLAVFGCWFAVHPTAVVAHRERPGAVGRRSRLVTSELVGLAAAQMLIGVVFGAVQTGTTVLAIGDGKPGLAGLMHALLGVGSVVAGLACAALPARFGYERRILAFAVGLLVLSSPLLLVDSLGTLVPAITALGFAVAPYMISVFMVAERIVPLRRLGAAMTMLAGATGIGYALGSGIGGRLADAGGHTPAFAVAVTAGALAVALAASSARRLAAVQTVVRSEVVRPADPVPVRPASCRVAPARPVRGVGTGRDRSSPRSATPPPGLGRAG